MKQASKRPPQTIKFLSQDNLPSAWSLLKPSWQAIGRNLITVVEVILLPLAASLIAFLIYRYVGNHHASLTQPSGSTQLTATDIITNGVSLVVGILLTPMLQFVIFQSVLKKSVDFWPALKQSWHYFWRFMGLLVLIVIATAIVFGSLAGAFYLGAKYAVAAAAVLSFVGLFIIGRLYLTPYYILDRDLKLFASIKQAWRESNGHVFSIWNIIIVNAVFGALIIVPIIGWIGGPILLLMYYAAPALRYQQIKQDYSSRRK